MNADAVDGPQPPRPPVAPRRPVRHQQFGMVWEDPYAWMRDPGWPAVTDPEVLAHLGAENAWFRATMAPHAGLVAELYDELCGRLAPDEESVPVRQGGWLYSWQFRPGAQYRVWRRQGLDDSEPVVILDENLLAEGRSYFSLRAMSPSPDGRLLAYSTDDDGSERYALHLRDLGDGHELADLVTNTSGSVVWAEDGRTMLFVELDPSLRPFRVRAHRLGEAAEDAPVLFEEADPAYFVSIGHTLDRRFLLVVSGSHDSRETWLLDAGQPGRPPSLVAARRPGHRYSVDHAHGRLWILTDDRHPNFRLVSADPAQPGEAGWREEIAADDTVYLVEHACFGPAMLLRQRRDGRAGIRVRDWDGAEHDVAFPEHACAPFIGDNREFDTDRVRLTYSSLVTPATVFDYLLAERRLVSRKVQRIPSGYDPSLYVSEELTAAAPDGVEVPVTLLRRRDKAPGGPLFLYGYGSYGHGMDDSFVHMRLTLVDRGFIYAVAHVRGGDEKGPRWWQGGKLEHKENTFGDFIACAEALVAAGHAEPGGIAIKGASAGGMLVGVVLNMRPDLWRCAIAEVPFVDVLGTMLDASLPLTPIEWPEWGDPIRDEAAFHRIRSYSPYDNVQAKAYPHILATAGLSDPRVGYWEPAKWVARLRETKTDDNLLLLKTNMEAGHFGRSGRYEALRDLSEQYAFVLACFGMAGEIA
ncbi:MAG TPA: S9 family peptidase [Geminicoccaceae bacterium]|nr:S9 family peptidase [Geminicoccus sp.]HMU52107.1 S9 family peptidase [Geminicoccaceae bacterium]